MNCPGTAYDVLVITSDKTVTVGRCYNEGQRSCSWFTGHNEMMDSIDVILWSELPKFPDMSR